MTDADAGVHDPSGRDRLYWVTLLHVGREGPEGVAPGFDLDGRVSDETDAESCFQPDFVSPSGVRGVDSQLARLVPALEEALEWNLDDVSDEAIETGRTVVLLRVEDAGHLERDDGVSVTWLRGTLPEGTTRPTADTVFEVPCCEFEEAAECEDAAPTDAAGFTGVVRADGAIHDGRLRAGPLAPIVPLYAAESQSLRIDLRSAELSFAIGETELRDGVLGGELPVSREPLPPSPERRDLVRSWLADVTDLDPDDGGVCRRVSASFVLAATAVERARAVAGCH